VLHGFDHRAAGNGGDPRSWFFRNFYTASESEFLELTREEADRRLGLGLEVFRSTGLAARGFVPPAWLLNDAVLDALRARGFDYTNTLKKIIDLKSGRVSHSWAQVYSSRAAWRRRVSVGWNELLWNKNSSAEIVRISIHPPERRYPMLWNHLESLISRGLEGRQTLTYVEFVDQQRRAGS
jgi:predicted deacetylase